MGLHKVKTYNMNTLSNARILKQPYIDPTPQFTGREPLPVNVGITINIAKRNVKDLEYLSPHEMQRYNKLKHLIVKIKIKQLSLSEYGDIRELNEIDRLIGIRKVFREASIRFFSYEVLGEKMLESAKRFPIRTVVQMRLVCKGWTQYIDEKILPHRGHDIVYTAAHAGTSYNQFWKQNWMAESAKLAGKTASFIGGVFLVIDGLKKLSKYKENSIDFPEIHGRCYDSDGGWFECKYKEDDEEGNSAKGGFELFSSFPAIGVPVSSHLYEFFHINKEKIRKIENETKSNFISGSGKISRILTPKFAHWKLEKCIKNLSVPGEWQENDTLNIHLDGNGEFTLFPCRDMQGNHHDFRKVRQNIQLEEIEMDIQSFYKIQMEIRK